MNRAIFFDKDGVLNELVSRPEGVTPPWNLDELQFINDSKRAVNLVKSMGFKVFMVTNQPDMLDGKMTPAAFNDIMELNSIYFGFDGVRAATRRGSDDYKPNTGMVDIFVEKYKIDVSQSFMIGDSWKDVVCGSKAGLTTFYVDPHMFEKDDSYKWSVPDEWKHIRPNYTVTDVMSACLDIALNRMEILRDETVR